MFAFREYCRAQSLQEAWELYQKKQNRVAGGMLWLRQTAGSFHTLIDLSDLGLEGIQETETELRIGAMTTLRQLETDGTLRRLYGGAVKEALRHIVGVQFRNMATVGGSLAGSCGFSDVLTLFLALGTEAELYKGGRMPLRDYAAQKRDRDILTGVILPKDGTRVVYQSVRANATDFPILAVAAARRRDGSFAAAVGARPGRAVLAEDTEHILRPGTPVTEESAAAFAESVAARPTFGSNTRGSAAYREHLCRVLVRRGVLALEGGTA